jgi:hypothetical protein
MMRTPYELSMRSSTLAQYSVNGIIEVLLAA